MSHFFHIHHTPTEHPDIVLIGAGIMSATLGVFLKELQPGLKIEIYERLDRVAAESSDAWNNAGTGHSAFCELNYTPQHEDGSVEISKAVKIAEQFEISKQFWAYLVKNKKLPDAGKFVHPVPHLSFVWGEKEVEYLRKRFTLLSERPLFKGMQWSESFDKLKEWIPLMMEKRNREIPVAATRMDAGTDMNFGELTRALFGYLTSLPDVTLHLEHEVNFLEKRKDGHWEIEVKDTRIHQRKTLETKFVFIGAGGGSLPLLENADIPEGKGFGGFPVSGQWLVCKNEKVIDKHAVKVYGKAEVGAPPMSVPHLDTRIINGKKALLFGPYAGFSTKFLKHGSFMDLPASLQLGNIVPIMSAGLHNIPLTKYLVEQVRQSPEDRLNALKKFVPTAVMEDWELMEAGQRVQVIKKDHKEGGVLEFGTEIVNAADGSIAALLGASPGASTSVPIMLEVLRRCFPLNFETEAWQKKLKEIIPSFGEKLDEHPALCAQTRKDSAAVLGIHSGSE